MFSRLFVVAFATTAIAAIPLYFVSASEYSLNLDRLPLTLLAIFCVAVFAAFGAGFGSTSADLERESGEVKWFNASKGFGFITRENGEEIFVHFRAIRGEGRRVLRDGQKVEFAVTESKKGLQAEDVAVAS